MAKKKLFSRKKTYHPTFVFRFLVYSISIPAGLAVTVLILNIEYSANESLLMDVLRVLSGLEIIGVMVFSSVLAETLLWILTKVLLSSGSPPSTLLFKSKEVYSLPPQIKGTYKP